MASSSRARRTGFGCLMLFALPFAGVGIGATYWTVSTLAEHAAMQSWVETPATINHAELKRKRGEDNDTFHVSAEYEYEFGGRRYTGDRVGLHGGSDNIGDFQQKAYNEIDRHRRQKKLFRAFVNPRDPAEAVLYRDLRWEMLAFYTVFATTFGAVGLGMITGVIAQLRSMPPAVQGEVPAAMPWMSRADWSSGQIRQKSGAVVAVPVLAVLSVYWAIAAAPLMSKLPQILPPAQEPKAWLILAFPAVWFVLVAALWNQYSRKRKFGDSTLQLATTPGVVGGQLAGVVRIERMVPAASGFRMSLSCVERVQKNKDNTSDEVRWQDERLVMEPIMDRTTGTMAVPVLFAIPYEAIETSHGKSTRNIDWRLEVSAKLAGVDYKSRFEVPVFKTADSRADFQLDEKLAADFAAAPRRDVLLREAGIVREPLPGEGVRLVFPAARNLSSAVVMTLVVAVLTTIIVVLMRVDAPILFPIVFGLFHLLFLWTVIDLWLYRSVVEARADGFKFRGGLFGIGRNRSFTADEVNRFATRNAMSSGTQVWKNIVVVPKNGKTRTLAQSIYGKLAQQAVIDELNAALRRESAPAEDIDIEAAFAARRKDSKKAKS